MVAALKLVETDNSDGGGGTRRALALEDRLEWLQHVRESGLAKGNHFLVAHCLFDHCNCETGRCDPGPSRISKECKITNVKRSIRKLAELGFIRIRPSEYSSCNQYDLIFRDDNNFQHGSPMTPPGVTDDPPPGSPMNRGGGSPKNPKPVVNLESEPVTEPEEEPGPESGLIPDDWRPCDRSVEFAHKIGMDNTEIELQIPLFVQFNLDLRKVHQNWLNHWKRWVTAWKRRQIEVATGDTSKSRAERIAADISRGLASKPSKAPSPLAMLPAGPPSDFTKSMRKQIANDEGQPEAVHP